MKSKSIASELHRSNLSAFAIVEAQLTKGLKHPTDYLLPFFQEMIRREKGNNFVVKTIVENIEKEYSLSIPVYLADSLVPRLVEHGYLEYDKDHRCHISRTASSNGTTISLNESEFFVIEKSIADYASKYGIQSPLHSSDWIKALLNFFSQEYISTKFTKFGNKIISNPKEHDDRIVSSFIIDCEQKNNELFTSIKKLYAAFSIADTIITIQNTGHVEDWNTLRLAYDATVLMRLLGTSGNLLKSATLEMHNMLQDMGCKTFYFDHTLTEFYSNIDGILERHQRGDPIHRETAQALENGEISIANIHLLKGNADVQLGKLNITQIVLPARIENSKYQVNIYELEGYLKKHINYRNYSEAAMIDAESIEKIVFLRKGKKATDLPKSGYIFVTHNTQYAKVGRSYTREFCGYRSFDTPPIITLGVLTKLSWLATDRKVDEFDFSRDLVSNCFQASLPDDKWFNKFWKTIEETHPELLDANVHDSLYLLDVRHAAKEASIGNSALFDDIDISTLIANAKEARTERERKHKEEIEEIKRDRELSIQEQKQKIGKLEKDYEAQLEQEKTKTSTEISIIKDELRMQSDEEINKQKEKHEEALRKKIQETKHEVGHNIDNQIKEKSIRQARIVSRIATLVLASIFAGIFIISLFEQLPSWIPVQYSGLIKIIAGFLGAVQVVGLFVDKFSFLFLGPALEKHISLRLIEYYKGIVAFNEKS